MSRSTRLRLQFGHGCDAVESGVSPPASSGGAGFNSATVVTPWKGDGQHHAIPQPRCFNSATVVTPWKGIASPHSISCMSGFNSATVVTPWKGRHVRGPGHTRGCFNSATVVTPWKDYVVCSGVRQDIPLQFGHGCDAVESCLLVSSTKRCESFNSATVVTPWKAQSSDHA